MVLATDSPNTRNATKLKNAAHTTAHCGRSTRVDTTVAIEFAASWKPFMKSNASASAIRNTIISNPTPVALTSISDALCRSASPVLEHDAFDHVGHVLALVGDGLQKLIHLLQLDDLARIGLLAKQLGERRTEHVVGLGLQPIDLAADAQDGVAVLQGLETRHRLLDAGRAGDADLGELLRLDRHRAHVVQEQALRGVLHEIQHVVHVGDELVDLVAI